MPRERSEKKREHLVDPTRRGKEWSSNEWKQLELKVEIKYQVSGHIKQTILPRSVTVSIIDVEVSVHKIHALLFILCGMNECFSSDILALIDLQLSP